MTEPTGTAAENRAYIQKSEKWEGSERARLLFPTPLKNGASSPLSDKGNGLILPGFMR